MAGVPALAAEDGQEELPSKIAVPLLPDAIALPLEVIEACAILQRRHHHLIHKESIILAPMPSSFHSHSHV